MRRKDAGSRAEETLRSLKKQEARFVVPAPVIAELSRDRPGSERVSAENRARPQQVEDRAARLHDADVAGAMVARMALGLDRRTTHESGHLTRFDRRERTPIGAWCAGHDNRDAALRRALTAIQSTVQLVCAAHPPDRGQLLLAHVELGRPAEVVPRSRRAPVTAPGSPTAWGSRLGW